jgi:zinc transport system permease protein
MDEALTLSQLWADYWTTISAAFIAAGLCGLLGFFVVLRRVAFVTAALGQVSLLGVAGGFLLGNLLGHDPHGPTPLHLDPVILALVVTAAVSGGLAYGARLNQPPTEVMVAFVYAAASALGLIVLALQPTEEHEFKHLMVGSLIGMEQEHLVELCLVAAVTLIICLFLFKDFLFVSFDRETARTLRLPVTALEVTLSVLIGLSVAVATRAIGILPVFGFLVLPAGAAFTVSSSVALVLTLSVVGAMLAAGVGFYLSVLYDLPTGAAMVACAALYWPLAFVTRAVMGASKTKGPLSQK